jgi:tripartite-type tricarboxylate transporter receptor subunit TctC
VRQKGSKASYGYGSPPALAAAELLKKGAGLQAVAIGYKTSVASMPEMYSGALDFQFIDGTFGSTQIRAGKLRGLAISGGQRSPFIDLPTMREAANIPDFDIAPWWGVFLPAGASSQIVSRLESWFNQIVASEETRKYLSGNTAEPFPGNAKFLADYLPKEIKKWSELIRGAGIEPQ